MTNLFDSLINRVASFIAAKGGFSHVMALLFAGAVLCYANVPDFRTLAQHVYAALPSWVEEIATAVIGVYVWYRTSNSPAGTLALARDIKAAPDTPTVKQVDAADPNVTK